MFLALWFLYQERFIFPLHRTYEFQSFCSLIQSPDEMILDPSRLIERDLGNLWKFHDTRGQINLGSRPRVFISISFRKDHVIVFTMIGMKTKGSLMQASRISFFNPCRRSNLTLGPTQYVPLICLKALQLSFITKLKDKFFCFPPLSLTWGLEEI